MMIKRKFIDLIDKANKLSPAVEQIEAKKEFPSIVAASRLNYWDPSLPISNCVRRLLIGVAADYSVEDLKLLDVIGQRLQSPSLSEYVVDVFNTSDCKNIEDFELYIPGIGRVYQTPIVGLWESGALVMKASGLKARTWLQENL